MEHLPTNRLTTQQMPEELRDNPQPIRLVSVNSIVVLREHLLKQLPPHAVELAEALANQTEELIVRPLLRATLDDHAGQFLFFAGRQVDAHELVAGFLEAAGGHDG